MTTLTTFRSTLQSVVPSLSIAATPVAVQPPVPTAITLSQLLDHYVARYSGRDPSVGWRLQTWRRLLGGRRVIELTSTDVREALRKLASEPPRAYRGRDVDGKPIHRMRGKMRSPGTINRYHAALSSVMQWAIEQEILPLTWPNPCRGIKRGKENPGVVRFLEPDERRRLLDACKASGWTMLYAFVLLALTSGARRGELLRLTWRDVDLEQGVAHLRVTKNGEPRVLVLTPAVVEELRSHKGGQAPHLVFRSTRDPLRPYALEQAWRTALKASGVERFRLHDCRHSFASMLAQDGASLVELADALGHRTMTMVRRYAHLSAKSRAALVNRVMGDVR